MAIFSQNQFADRPASSEQSNAMRLMRALPPLKTAGIHNDEEKSAKRSISVSPSASLKSLKDANRGTILSASGGYGGSLYSQPEKNCTSKPSFGSIRDLSQSQEQRRRKVWHRKVSISPRKQEFHETSPAEPAVSGQELRHSASRQVPLNWGDGDESIISFPEMDDEEASDYYYTAKENPRDIPSDEED
ncbi:hypothetical protein KEM55_000560, partial [Ascosphaera atra]